GAARSVIAATPAIWVAGKPPSWSIYRSRAPPLLTDRVRGRDDRRKANHRLFVLERLLRLAGTFLPFLRASERPMAMACLRLFTLPPLPPLPLFSVPVLRRCMALFTSLLALREYLAMSSSTRS